MKSLTNSINNLAAAINNLAASYKNKNSYTPISKTTTSNPASNVHITSFKTYGQQQEKQTVIITTEEYKALTAIYNAMTDKGAYPDHYDHVRREIAMKWPILSKALNELVKARSYYTDSASKYKSIWKYDK